MQNMQQTKRGETRITWGKTLVNFATALWVGLTILVGPVLLAKLEYRMSLGETNPALDASIRGVLFGIVIMLTLGGCIERKIR